MATWWLKEFVTRARAQAHGYHLDAMGFRLGYYTKMKYPWVLQIGVKIKVWWFLVFSGVVYVAVVTRAQARARVIVLYLQQIYDLHYKS